MPCSGVSLKDWNLVANPCCAGMLVIRQPTKP